MEKWRVIYAGNSELGEADIKQGISQGDFSCPLVFVLLIALSLILRKTKATYELSGSKEKINHLLFMDGLQ